MKILEKLVAYVKPRVAEPVITVEQIHAEVDSLEEKSIKAVEELLRGINIPTEDRVVGKGKLMEELGFGSANEVIKQKEATLARIEEATNLKSRKEAELNLINEYRLSYPKDKIIPFSEFNKVLEKYKLIYAPSKAYIKDVPEKNLLEIKNSKRKEKDHNIDNTFIVTKIELSYSVSETSKKRLEEFSKNNSILLNPIMKSRKAIGKRLVSNTRFLSQVSDIDSVIYEDYETYEIYYTKPEGSDLTYLVQNYLKSKNILLKNEYLRSSECHEMNRNVLFIAAPKSHFDLESLNTYDGKEYFLKTQIEITKQEIKDPIAFEMLKGVKDSDEVFVRIISKWGTKDDVSYLDPIVQNEQMN